jgi:hypothetical protein
MRINGFEQIKSLYSIVFSQEYDFTPQHISLYVFFINQNNRNNWVEWFKCPYDLAMAGACIGSKKTYYKCLNDLQEWKLLQYEKGSNNWKAPKIKLAVLKCTSSDTSSVPQSEPLPTPLPTQAVEPLPTHIYKPITNNLKPKEDIEERKLKFAHTLKPFVDEYGREMLVDFYEYWTEPNKSNTKFRQELEKTWNLNRRLKTWAGYDSKFGKTKSKEVPKSEKWKTPSDIYMCMDWIKRIPKPPDYETQTAAYEMFMYEWRISELMTYQYDRCGAHSNLSEYED